ncbi:MAG TPA: hypothetical protein VHQ65_05135 [Thermoanaerobaculia bacterium]|nr:hypothetical protein [Thermoanaerobaculia bacterium]
MHRFIAALLVASAAMAPAAGAAPAAQPSSRQAASSSAGATVRPAPPRLGDVAFPTSATSPAAQEHFLRGVAALHSFWYDEAADAFRAAREAEPGFALAAWGEAMTCNHPIWNQVDLECGRRALAALAATPEARAAKAPTARERGYLAAVEALFDHGLEGKAERDAAYERAMADLAATWPDDPEATIFHALALQGLVYGHHVGEERRFGLLMRSAAALEELFDRAPRHPGVLHYLIHAYDDPVHAPLGLRAARIYAEVAPAAHHALHMPSHIFVQLGRWAEAAASNEDAWAASVAWQERRGHDLGKRDYHSLSWLVYAYLQQGKLGAAGEALERARRSLAASGGDARIRRGLAGMEARYRLETGRWPPASSAAATPQETADGHGPAVPHQHSADPEHAAHPDDGSDHATFAAALAALEAGDSERARAVAGELAGGDVEARVMALEIDALALLAEGQEESALGRLDEAAVLEQTLPPPSGPPGPPKPALELYGDVLLELGLPEQAGHAYALALLRTPRRAASLLGAARAAAARGDRVEARRHYEELAALWSEADPDLPALAEVRAALAPTAEVAAEAFTPPAVQPGDSPR